MHAIVGSKKRIRPRSPSCFGLMGDVGVTVKMHALYEELKGGDGQIDDFEGNR